MSGLWYGVFKKYNAKASEQKYIKLIKDKQQAGLKKWAVKLKISFDYQNIESAASIKI